MAEQVKNEIDVDAWIDGEPQPDFSSSGGGNMADLLGKMSHADIQEFARLLAPAINKVNADNGAVAVPMEGPLRYANSLDQHYAVKVEDEDYDPLHGDTAELEKNLPPEEYTNDIFGESTYTLFYICPFGSLAFRYALFIYFVQITTYLLTLADVIDWASPDNRLNIPPMVDTTVTLAQAVCLLQTLAFQSDLIEAVLKLQDGHYPEAEREWPGATFNTWLFSCLAQLSAAMCLLIGNFVLTFQVDDVLELMLNFVALNFMAEIDDMGFYIAKMGFISDRLQAETEAVDDFHLPKRKSNGLVRKALYMGCNLLLFIGYGILKNRQLQGVYLQRNLYVQFGDAYNPKIPFYSGILSSEKGAHNGYREYRDIGTEQILLSWCDVDRRWTFSDTNDPCDYFARSRETDSYDVTTVSNADWEIRDSFGRFKPFETFTLIGRDCEPDICKGECVDRFCVCPDNRFGIDCEFDEVCPELVINSETPPFTPHSMLDERYGMIAASMSSRFELLINEKTGQFTKVYNMPVYYSNESYPANIIFFGGRRWVIAAENSFHNFTELQYAEDGSKRWFFREETLALLESGDFHGYDKAKFLPLFLSDPVDFETPDFLPTPTALGWYTVSFKNLTGRIFVPASEVDTKLICTMCSGDNGGYCESDGGSCNATTGMCDCKPDYTGAACEKRLPCYEQLWPCNGNGICDEVSGICRCNPPYFGEICGGTLWCVEEAGQCYNGGVCDEELGECACSEDPWVFGYACEKRADPTIFGCENGGSVVDITSTECNCTPPFYGQLCSLVDTSQEMYLCSSNEDCAAETTCNVTTGICDCGDTQRYGTLCEYIFDCHVNGCMNGGSCNNETGLCDCIDYHVGHDCSKLPDCTSDWDCWQGTCNNQTGHCECWWNGFFGKQCQIRPVCQRNNNFCYNGGSCNAQGYCECPTPFTGPNCELILSSVKHECLECAQNH